MGMRKRGRWTDLNMADGRMIQDGEMPEVPEGICNRKDCWILEGFVPENAGVPEGFAREECLQTRYEPVVI